MNRRIWLIIVFAGMLGALLTACSSNQGTTPSGAATTTTPPASGTTSTAPAAQPAAPTTPVATPEPTTPPQPAPPAAPTGVPALPPEGVFSGATAALDALSSYRYSTLFTFVGEAEGQVEAGSIELTGIVAGPTQKHLIWRDLGEGTQFEVIEIENQAWMLQDEGWEEAPLLVAEAMSQAVLIYAPSIAWSGAFGELETDASYVGEETVNGVAAYHYTTTYSQWGTYWPGQLESASGDVWIAKAGYPVKYSFSATAVDEEGQRGTVTWQTDLTDVNAPITIEPPTVSEPGS
jgi:hypothetical protein